MRGAASSCFMARGQRRWWRRQWGEPTTPDYALPNRWLGSAVSYGILTSIASVIIFAGVCMVFL